MLEDKIKSEISPYRGRLVPQCPLARHTSWRVGGCAQYAYYPTDLEDLKVFLNQLSTEQPLTWLGLGSNLLIRDGGIMGTVILTRYGLKSLHQQDDGLIRAEAGVPCAKLAKFCLRYNLTGGEFFAGIPGTVGGALVMNAGAFGGETWKYLVAVDVIDRKGCIHSKSRSDFQVAYRNVSGLPDNQWFVAGYFCFASAQDDTVKQDIHQLLARRDASQPIGKLSCGSVFKNPPGDHAARLIETCGLKGYRIGGAHISMKHANFIINTGQATATDIEALIEHIEQIVWKTQCVRLEKEVHILGLNTSKTMLE